MSASEPSPADLSEAGRGRRSAVWLIAILMAYAVYRAPFVLNQLGGQDEQLFAVPGLTVAREVARLFNVERKLRSFIERFDPGPPAIRPAPGWQFEWTKLDEALVKGLLDSVPRTFTASVLRPRAARLSAIRMSIPRSVEVSAPADCQRRRASFSKG